MNLTSKKNTMALLLFVLSTINVFYCTYIFQSMWLWFLVPLGLMKLGFVHAFGISCLMSVIFLKMKDIEDKEEIKSDKKKLDDVIKLTMKLIVYMTYQSMFFLLAYICHLCM